VATKPKACQVNLTGFWFGAYQLRGRSWPRGQIAATNGSLVLGHGFGWSFLGISGASLVRTRRKAQQRNADDHGNKFDYFHGVEMII
jgi:hypothetical protein